MRNFLTMTAIGLLCTAGMALAQSQGRPPAPANQLTPQVLGEMLRSATTFHELVENLNLNRNFGPDVHTLGPNGLPQHPVERTAQTIGAGAGVGAAIGAMTKGQNGVLIGALVGGAGGLILDQILKHREETQARQAYPVAPPVVDPDPAPSRQFRQRPLNQ